MINKAFLGLVAIAAAATGALCYYAYSWIGSIGDPVIASQGYVSNSNISWMVLWISFLILTAIAVASLWIHRSRWPLWTAFAYFAAFSVVFMLNDMSFTAFVEANSLETEHTLLNPFFVAVLLVVVLIGILAAQILTISLRVKIKKEDHADNADTSEEDLEEED